VGVSCVRGEDPEKGLSKQTPKTSRIYQLKRKAGKKPISGKTGNPLSIGLWGKNRAGNKRNQLENNARGDESVARMGG